MSAGIYLALSVVTLGVLYFFIPAIINGYLRFRGTRVVVCPETRKTAAVEVDAPRAALAAAFGGPRLRLRDCSRWPERQDCGQECLLQVELAPEDCLARTMLTRWYEGKLCAYCSRPFAEISWADHKPALLTAGGKILEWCEIPAEGIPEALSDDLPVCWDCRVAETFGSEHPELVVERPWKRRGLVR